MDALTLLFQAISEMAYQTSFYGDADRARLEMQKQAVRDARLNQQSSAIPGRAHADRAEMQHRYGDFARGQRGDF